jgi:hypothetical protein
LINSKETTRYQTYEKIYVEEKRLRNYESESEGDEGTEAGGDEEWKEEKHAYLHGRIGRFSGVLQESQISIGRVLSE